VDVRATLSIVAVTVLVPTVVPVKVEVYVPSPWSVTVPNVPCAVPLPRLKTIAEPPVVNCVPLESLAVNVTVEVPPRAIGEGFKETVDCAGSAVAGVVTVIVGGVDVSAVLSIVALTVLVPAVVPVNTAEYVPSP